MVGAGFGDYVCLVCTYKIFEKFDPGISTRPFSVEAETKVFNGLGLSEAVEFYRSPKWETLVDEWLEKGMP